MISTNLVLLKLQNNSGQYRITIPKDLVKLLKWKQGTDVVFVLDKDGNLVLKEIKKK